MIRKRQITENKFTHEFLWRIANQHFEQAEQSEKGEKYYSHLSALLFYYLAYEAFINYLGEVLLPMIWANERIYFKGEKAGIEGKITELIAELTKNGIEFYWEKGVGPYQKIKQLEDFRHTIVHGKIITDVYVVVPKVDGTHLKWKMPWDSFVNSCNVKQSRDSIKQFCQALLNKVRQRADYSHLIHDAFTGSLASASGKNAT